MSFFEELKRRRVFRVGIAYLVAAWLIAQVLDLVLGSFEAPAWAMQAVLALLAAGFFLALLLAWAYAMTPQGIRRETGDEQARRGSHAVHVMYFLVIGVLAVTAAWLYVDRERLDGAPAPGIDALVDRPSVIVLPFANISGRDSHDYLAFGITDELIAGLQRLGNFPVMSRNASLSFGLTDITASEYAQNLGASYLVEGSVNVINDEIRVLANLAGTGGNQVWAERYELREGDVNLFDVTDELASKVATAVLESEVQRVQRTDRPPADAWEHYVKGLQVVLTYEHEEYETARAHLDRAVEIAPDMAEAWWALGELEIMNYMTGSLGDEEDFEHLYELIGYFRKAHEISPFHAAACGCLGYLLTAVGQPDEARVVYEQAIEAKPLSPDLRVDYAIYLAWSGRHEEALENADLALRLGPVSQDRAGVWAVRAVVALARGEESEALNAVNRAMFIRKDTYYTPVSIALLYVLGKHDEARKLWEETQSIFPDLKPRNPVFYVTLKPIDDILAERQALGDTSVPADVEEIFASLGDG